MFKKSYVGMLLALCCVNSMAALRSYEDLNKELIQAMNIFAVDNIVQNKFPADRLDKWNDVMADVNMYVIAELSKERSLGQRISQANQEAIRQIRGLVELANQAFINTIMKPLQTQEVGGARVQSVKNRLHVLKQYEARLANANKTLAAAFGDSDHTTKIKDILKKAALALSEFTKKLEKDIEKPF